MIIFLLVIPTLMMALGVLFIIQKKIPLQKDIGMAWTLAGSISFLLTLIAMFYIKDTNTLFGLIFIQAMIFLLSILPIQIRFIIKNWKRRK